jgi:hypothetical protein
LSPCCGDAGVASSLRPQIPVGDGGVGAAFRSDSSIPHTYLTCPGHEVVTCPKFESRPRFPSQKLLVGVTTTALTTVDVSEDGRVCTKLVYCTCASTETSLFTVLSGPARVRNRSRDFRRQRLRTSSLSVYRVKEFLLAFAVKKNPAPVFA